MTTLLCYRFSAFGDVLMTIPVVMEVLDQNPDVRIIYLTREKFAPYFPLHNRLRIVSVNLDKGRFKTLKLLALLRQLIREEHIQFVLDLHVVLRTLSLNLWSRFLGCKLVKLDKSRAARRAFLKHKKNSRVPPMTQQYRKVFMAASLRSVSRHYIHPSGRRKKPEYTPAPIIGYAPMTLHATKSWSLESAKALVNMICQELGYTVYLFGGDADKKLLQELVIPGVENYAGLQDPVEEMERMSLLSVLITMDSANMHLGDLLGIPLITIWGGTHPEMGFKPRNSTQQILIEPKVELPCRPCSVYGRAECVLEKKQFACLEDIKPNSVIRAIKQILSTA